MSEWAFGFALNTENWKEHCLHGNNNCKIHIFYKAIMPELYGDIVRKQIFKSLKKSEHLKESSVANKQCLS